MVCLLLNCVLIVFVCGCVFFFQFKCVYAACDLLCGVICFSCFVCVFCSCDLVCGGVCCRCLCVGVWLKGVCANVSCVWVILLCCMVCCGSRGFVESLIVCLAWCMLLLLCVVCVGVCLCCVSSF